MSIVGSLGPLRLIDFSEENRGDWSKLRGALPADLAARARSFLEGGELLIVSPGRATDWFVPGQIIPAMSGARTDGVWLWPSELGWHVEQYLLGLPKSLLDHMSVAEFRANIPSPEELEELGAACYADVVGQ